MYAVFLHILHFLYLWCYPITSGVRMWEFYIINEHGSIEAKKKKHDSIENDMTRYPNIEAKAIPIFHMEAIHTTMMRSNLTFNTEPASCIFHLLSMVMVGQLKFSLSTCIFDPSGASIKCMLMKTIGSEFWNKCRDIYEHYHIFSYIFQMRLGFLTDNSLYKSHSEQ